MYIPARPCTTLLAVPFIAILLISSASAAVLPDSGWWWDPNQNGIGWFIERQGSEIFLVSYLYDSSGKATWNLATGVMSGSTFTAPLNVYCCGETVGGPFQPNRPTGTVGTASITWSDSQHGTMSWPNGTFNIQRFSFTAGGNILPPQAGSPQIGWWWDPDEPGVGYAIEIQGNAAFFGVFTYDVDGAPIWYLSTQNMSSATQYFGHWDQYCCGEFLGGANKQNQLVGSVGNLNISFNTVTTGVMTKPTGVQVPIERFQFSPDTPVLPISVLTAHNDSQRTGQNTHETILNATNVSANFGRVMSLPVDGQVYAQPLVVSGLNIGGVTHNVVYVATEHDSVYAFDADARISTPFWRRSFINPAGGINTAASNDVDGISPERGVTSTPVIDTSTNTLYVLAETNDNGSNAFRIHALDLATGAEKFGGPKVLSPSVSGTGADSVNGTITINAGCLQRAALLLTSGNVYVSWGSCSHGWVVAVNATSLATTAIFNTSPNGKGAPIWMGGGGPAVDRQGNIILMTGVDADSTTNTGYSNAFIKLSPSLLVADFFIPSNNVFLTQNDADLGSGGPMIPPFTGSPIVIGGGKDGRVFVLNSDNMGGMATTDRALQEVQTGTQQFDNLFDTPTYWNGLVFVHPENDVLHAFSWSGSRLSTTPTASGSIVYGVHGATASVSSDGTHNGIVWEVQVDGYPSGPAVLHAFPANNLTQEIYNGSRNVSRDLAGPAVKFAVPTVANGRVYVGCGNQLDIYGVAF